ncbi:MAG: glycosyltransferase [Ignavibacteriales bacterium]|nr:glycosyltransferase [Ignavibacteriales bacterium]
MIEKRIDRLTVLMTVYNGEEFLASAIESILRQTYNNFEFLIINDGSTDNTEKIIQSYTDDRIRYMVIKQSGISKAINFGLRNASNQWVAIMDADDIAHPAKLEQQLSAMDTAENTICSTWSIHFQKGKLLYAVETPVNNAELKQKLNLHSYICHPGVIYNRDFILKNGGYNEEISTFADYDLWLRVKDKANFVILPQYLMFMRVNEKSNSRADFFRTRKIIYELQQKYIFDKKEMLAGFSSSELTVLNGWREYFYGDIKKAIPIWMNNISSIWRDKRIAPAILSSFLPESIAFKIKDLRLRLRLKLFFNQKIDKRLAKRIISEK